MGDSSVKLVAILDLQDVVETLEFSTLTVAQVAEQKKAAYAAADSFNSVRIPSQVHEDYKKMWDEAWNEFAEAIEPAFERARRVNQIINEVKFIEIAKNKQKTISQLSVCVSTPDWKNTHKRIQDLRKQFWDQGFAGSYDADLKSKFNKIANQFYLQVELRKQEVVRRAEDASRKNALKKMSFEEMKSCTNNLRSDLFAIDAGKMLNRQYQKSLDAIIDEMWVLRKGHSKSGAPSSVRTAEVHIPKHPSSMRSNLALPPKSQAPKRTEKDIRQERSTINYRKGYALTVGREYKQEFNVAKDFFELAAKDGHAEAMRALGVFHQYGFGVPVDKALAEHWYSRSLSLGDVRVAHHRSTLNIERELNDVDISEIAKKIFLSYFRSGLAPGQNGELEGLANLRIRSESEDIAKEASSRASDSQRLSEAVGSYRLERRHEEGSMNPLARLVRLMFGKH